MPKTTDIEKLEGNPGRRQPPINEPRPPKGIPQPPEWLGGKATEAYHELSQIVGPDGMNTMAKTDGIAMAMLCDAFIEYRYARDELENGTDFYKEDPEAKEGDKPLHVNIGRYYISKDGLVKRHPAVGDMQDAWKRVAMMLGQFGMTPVARKNVQALGKKKEKTREQKMAEKRKKMAEVAKKAAEEGSHIRKAK